MSGTKPPEFRVYKESVDEQTFVLQALVSIHRVEHRRVYVYVNSNQ